MLCGLFLLIAGLYIAWESFSFPALAGMPYGSGLFPLIAAAGMAICGVLILVTSFLFNPDTSEKAVDTKKEKPSVKNLVNFFIVIAVVVFYALFFVNLGFHLVSFFTLWGLFLLLGQRIMFSLILAVAVTVGVHFIFYSLLHVPLPWGVLEPWAW